MNEIGQIQFTCLRPCSSMGLEQASSEAAEMHQKLYSKVLLHWLCGQLLASDGCQISSHQRTD